MRCQSLSRKNRMSILGCAMGSQCQSGIKTPSQSRAVCHKIQLIRRILNRSLARHEE